MESVIDQQYRKIVLDLYFEGAVLSGTPQFPKWSSACPFCSYARKTEAKRRSKCAALIWIPTQRTWKFTCHNRGSVQCAYPLTFANFLKTLNPELGRRYVQDRYSAGTTGKGTNCPNPDFLKRLGQPPQFRSRTQPKNQRQGGAPQSEPEEENQADPPKT